MTKKKLVIGIVVALIIVAIASFYIILKEENSNAISVSEKKWIEANKNQVIDIAVLNDLPYFGVDGSGIFFEFVADMETETGLKFNMISYNIGEVPLNSDFVFEIKPKSDKSELVFFTDYYAVIGDETIYSIDELKGKKIGVFKNDINLAKYYLQDANFIQYESINELFAGFENDSVDYVIASYLPNVNLILKENYVISYRLIDMANKYALSSNSKETKLNSIVTKYFNSWTNKYFVNSYKEQFVNLYFENKSIDDQTRSSLLSKKYVYGYVENLPYETVISDEMLGINSQYLNNFSALTGVEFVYKKYKNYKDLEKALTDGKIDIAFGYFNTTSKKVTATNGIYKNSFVTLNYKNDVTIDSVKSLDDNKVMIVNDSSIYDYTNKNSKVEIKKYSTNKELMSRMKNDSLIISDMNNYLYYKNSDYSRYNIALTTELDSDYRFLMSNKSGNEVFIDMFSHFSNTVNKNSYFNRGLTDLINKTTGSAILKLVVDYILYVLIGTVTVAYLSIKLFTRKKVKKQIKKEDKLKFVDMLTSLKNRNYLNYNMEKWDSNDTYPQAIIVIDLNNVKYINDNFGHEEGDNVIVNAANILINAQLDNTDIIRTDGNEFLVYLVGYKEDEVISYIRKLNREFKNLTHGFGAAVGYSMIKDGITTIDDAINEATLDMRTNKENLQD